MEYLPEFFSVAFLDFLAILSPGVATVLTIRNSFKYSKKVIIYSSLGLGLGILFDVIISLAGAGFLIAQSGMFFFIIKFIGASYLIYLGFKSLTDSSHIQISNHTTQENLTKLNALKMGFITNATNVNAYLFFLSIFSLVVSTKTPLPIKAIYGTEMALAEFICFATLGILISHKFVKQRLGNFQIIVEKVMGIILIILAIKIIFFS